MKVSITSAIFRIVLVISMLILLAIYLKFDGRYHFHILDSIRTGSRSLVNRTFVVITPRQNLTLSTTKSSTHSFATTSANDGNYYHSLSRGHYIKVGSKDIAIVTAVYNSFKPDEHGFNILLNGWAHIRPSLDFKCCVLNGLESKDNLLLEVPSKKYHIYKQWKVDMQNAEFSCTISKWQMKNLKLLAKDEPLKYVTFAEKSCKKASTKVIPIEYRKTIPNSIGICLKISYGTMNTELMVEWFEYQKLMGVTRVFSFLAEDLDDDARKVFQYYANTGFADINPIYPAPKNNGTHRGFRRPRWEHQAWVDEVMAINDCKHRMAGLDWVIVHDLDEWIVPEIEGDTIATVFQKAAKHHPNAGGFQLNAHAAILNWGDTRSSPLNVMRTTNLTTFANYDGADRNARFAWKSDRIIYAKNNMVYPSPGHGLKRVPGKLYTLIHRRYCKPKWVSCNRTEIRIRDDRILRYETQLIHNIGKLPLDSLLPNSSQYILGIRNWIKTYLLLK